MNFWSQFMRGSHFFWAPIPAYTVLPILLWIFLPSVWTFALAISVCITLTVLKIKGRKVPWVVRRMYSKLRGGVVHARSVFYRRQVLRVTGVDI